MQNGKSHKHDKGHEFIPKALDQFIDQVTGKGKAALGDVVSGTNEVLSEKVAALKEKASDWGLDELADDVKSYVKKNPWKGLGAAIGVGLFLGYLLSPSKRSKE